MPYRSGDCYRIDAAPVYWWATDWHMATGTTFSVLHIFLPSTACSSLCDLVVFRCLLPRRGGLVTESKRRLQSIIITTIVLAVMI